MPHPPFPHGVSAWKASASRRHGDDGWPLTRDFMAIQRITEGDSAFYGDGCDHVYRRVFAWCGITSRMQRTGRSASSSHVGLKIVSHWFSRPVADPQRSAARSHLWFYILLCSRCRRNDVRLVLLSTRFHEHPCPPFRARSGRHIRRCRSRFLPKFFSWFLVAQPNTALERMTAARVIRNLDVEGSGHRSVWDVIRHLVPGVGVFSHFRHATQ